MRGILHTAKKKRSPNIFTGRLGIACGIVTHHIRISSNQVDPAIAAMLILLLGEYGLMFGESVTKSKYVKNIKNFMAETWKRFQIVYHFLVRRIK